MQLLVVFRFQALPPQTVCLPHVSPRRTGRIRRGVTWIDRYSFIGEFCHSGPGGENQIPVTEL